MDEEIEPVTGYIKTHWDCPACTLPHEVEGDAQGDTFECDECGFKVVIDKVM